VAEIPNYGDTKTLKPFFLVDPEDGDTLNIIDRALQVDERKSALTPSAPASATVGVTSTLILAGNADRKGLILVNTSENFISLGFGSAAVLYSGVTLNPNGGSFEMGQYSFHTSAVYAISSGAASNLGVQEFE
jgi:hypothetical protein